MFKRLALIAVLCLLGLASPLVAKSLAGATSETVLHALWFAELGTHWQLLYVVLLSISVLGIAYLKRNALWLLPLGFCALPFFTASAAADKAGGSAADTLTVASANVYFENEDSRPLAAWLRERNADIVIVSEVSRAFGAQLDKLADFPHRKILTRDDPFGLAILSRHPLEYVQEFKSENDIPHIRAVVKWNGRSVAITAVHPLPPVQTGFMIERDRLLTAEARNLKDGALPSLLAGDLNTSAWSTGLAGPEILGLRRTTPLFRPTWPRVMRGLAGIPIDHVLASPHWRVVESAVGPDIGSDHFPVATVLRLAEAQAWK